MRQGKEGGRGIGDWAQQIARRASMRVGHHFVLREGGTRSGRGSGHRTEGHGESSRWSSPPRESLQRRAPILPPSTRWLPGGRPWGAGPGDGDVVQRPTPTQGVKPGQVEPSYGPGSLQCPARLCARRAPLRPCGIGRGSCGQPAVPPGLGLRRLRDGAAVQGVAVRGRGVRPSSRDERRGPTRPRIGCVGDVAGVFATVLFLGECRARRHHRCGSVSGDPSATRDRRKGLGGGRRTRATLLRPGVGDLDAVRCGRLRPTEARTGRSATQGTSRPIADLRRVCGGGLCRSGRTSR